LPVEICPLKESASDLEKVPRPIKSSTVKSLLVNFRIVSAGAGHTTGELPRAGGFHREAVRAG
jgi:hypothetical protein